MRQKAKCDGFILVVSPAGMVWEHQAYSTEERKLRASGFGQSQNQAKDKAINAARFVATAVGRSRSARPVMCVGSDHLE